MARSTPTGPFMNSTPASTQQRRIAPPSVLNAIMPANTKSTNVDDIRSQRGVRLLRGLSSVHKTVGSAGKATTWSIPKNLLAYHLPFSIAIKDGNLALPEDDPETFELLGQWLYAGESSTEATNSQPYIKAWILADKLGRRTFRDHAMIRILNGHKYDGFPEKPINPAWKPPTLRQDQARSLGILSARSDKWARVLEEAKVFEQDVTRALVRFGENSKQAEKYLEVLTHEGEKGFEFGNSPQDSQHRDSRGRSIFVMPQRPIDS